jgi:glycine betaine/choline ABC-type transport system substrate-binding protein
MRRWDPTISDALNDLSTIVITEDLRTMNRLVSDGQNIADVASAWLAENM